VARVDVDPEDRDQEPLVLEAIVACPRCGFETDAVFNSDPGVYELEDLTDAPEAAVNCSECGQSYIATYPGWTIHEDAG
jgi:transcription elongation factor Elf1